jgi:PAS domain S-box-containing protein
VADTPLTPPTGASGEMSYEEAEIVLRILAGQSADDSVAGAAPQPAEKPVSAPLAPPVPVAPLTSDVLRALVEAVPDAVVVTNAEGRIVFANTQTERLFGYQKDELLGQPVEILVPERVRDKHVGDRDTYAKEPRVRPMGRGLELSGRRKDGQEVPVEIGLSPLKTESGVLVVASIRDVAERRKAEGQLRKMEARYRTLVEGIPAVTFMAAMDEDANELYVSPQIVDLLGFSQKEWLENPILWYTQLHPDDQARWHQEFARTVSTGERFRSVYRFIAHDGRTVWVHGEAQLVRDEDGRPLFLQGVAFDITGMKEAEEQLRSMNATLAERVAERTRELARSNADLEDFGYRISHDLQTPLRTIKSYTQKVSETAKGQLGPEVDDWMNRVIKGANRMALLIRALLAYSRVGTHGKEFKPTDCGAVLDAALDMLDADLRDSGGGVTHGPLPTVMADESQLAQLFQNLIGNALKYREPDRAPVVHMQAERNGAEWLFSVVDNGLGVEEKFLERIFKLGERLHTESAYPGSGIGLATCTKIVHRHGGRIWATSPGLGQGTTVWFTIPAV